VTQAERTLTAVVQIESHGGDAVLAGHSLGGLTVTSVGTAAAENLVR
jgi:hypothetical protein